MKKYVAIILTALLLVSALAGCSAKKETTDSEKIKAAGKLVVGITDFAPMDYLGDNGEWIGFDADLARAFAESLGVKAEFTVIDWDNKTLELNAGNIDCIWNGMTLTDGVKAAMETSKPYCGNAQVVVAPKDKAAGLDYSALTFAVEAGSAAEELAQEKGWKVASMQSQGDALLEVWWRASTRRSTALASARAAIWRPSWTPSWTASTRTAPWPRSLKSTAST